MKRVVVKIALMLVLLVTTASVATPTHWRTLSPGLEYTQFNKVYGFHVGHLHAFRINLNYFTFALAMAADEQNPIATVAELSKENETVIGVNGGFFSQELKPLGLRISNHKQKNALKPTSWWGVFYISKDKPYIVSQKTFHKNDNIEFAVQSGPRLIVNGKIPMTLKTGFDNRTAIGVTHDNKVILAITENLKLSTTELSKIMRGSQVEGGLGCLNALNLDGGGSSQLYAHYKDFSLDVPGLSAVTDAIIVIPKKGNSSTTQG